MMDLSIYQSINLSIHLSIHLSTTNDQSYYADALRA